MHLLIYIFTLQWIYQDVITLRVTEQLCRFLNPLKDFGSTEWPYLLTVINSFQNDSSLFFPLLSVFSQSVLTLPGLAQMQDPPGLDPVPQCGVCVP